MVAELIRDYVVLATWRAKNGRLCFLGKEISGGDGETTPSHDAFYRPTAHDVGTTGLQLVMQPELVEGMVQMRAALLLARRVIEAGKEINLSLLRAGEKAGVELEAFSDQAGRYDRALQIFEKKHGKGAPMNEDLTR